MTENENATIVKSVMDELLRGNLAPFLAALTDDAVIQAVVPEGTPLSGDGFRGREGVARYFAALGEVMEILGVEDTEYVASGDKVVVLGRERARVKRSGAMLDCDTATVFTLREGKIAKIVALADMTPIVDAYREKVAR
jgi:uncharacterized protein